MKRLTLALVLACFALPACSAKDQPATDGAAPQAAAPAPASEPVVLAQADNTPPATPAPAERAPASAAAQPDAPAQVASVVAPRPDIVAGKHYRVLTPAQPTSSSPDKVEVAEFFMYMCPHCFTLEPFINSYLEDKPAHVSFVRVPAPFNRIAMLHAKGFYAAESLGVLEDLHTNFFRAYHNENNQLGNDKAMIKFFTDNGVSSDDASKALKSFAVDTKVRQADTLVRRYRIDSVPTLVVNGKYVTSGSMAGSIEKLREVLEYLVAMEAANL